MPGTRRKQLIANLLAENEETIAYGKQVNVILDAMRAKFKKGQEQSGQKVCDIVAMIEKARTKHPRLATNSKSTPRSGNKGSSGSVSSGRRDRKTTGRVQDPCESPTTLRKQLLCMKKCCVAAETSKLSPNKNKAKGSKGRTASKASKGSTSSKGDPRKKDSTYS
jgi:hypothetical protein